MNDTKTKILDPATYAEPEVDYTETEVAVPSQDIHPGDIRNARKVANVKHGSKWTYLYDDAGKTIEEVKKGDVVTVVRREPTNEFTTVQYRARINRGIAERLTNRGGSVRAVQAKVNEDLDKHGAIGADTLNRLLTVQAELKILNELAVVATRAEEGEDLVDVQREFADHLTNKLVRDTRQRSLSRTGTAVQNLLEDADRDAMAEFIERVRWAF